MSPGGLRIRSKEKNVTMPRAGAIECLDGQLDDGDVGEGTFVRLLRLCLDLAPGWRLLPRGKAELGPHCHLSGAASRVECETRKRRVGKTRPKTGFLCILLF